MKTFYEKIPIHELPPEEEASVPHALLNALQNNPDMANRSEVSIVQAFSSLSFIRSRYDHLKRASSSGIYDVNLLFRTTASKTVVPPVNEKGVFGISVVDPDCSLYDNPRFGKKHCELISEGFAQVFAWADVVEKDELGEIYREIAEGMRDENEVVAIEPTSSPSFVHDALQAISSKEGQIGTYSDFVSRRAGVEAVLYYL